MRIDGTEIIKLIGLSETDDKVLDLLELLKVDRPTLDEDGQSEGIDLEEELGLYLGFGTTVITERQKSENIGGLYLNDINFQMHFSSLPFNLKTLDNLEIVTKKIERQPNYIRVEGDSLDSEVLYWIFEDLGFLSVQFSDETQSEIIEICLMPYEDPTDEEYIGIIAPYNG